MPPYRLTRASVILFGSAALIEAVRDQTKTVGIKQVNAVLMQPHWRHNTRDEPAQPLVANNQKTKPK